MIKWQKIIGGSSTPLQPSAALKTPAAVQKVPGVGSLPFNETIKGLVSPSIDFSHSFSDKFELIIQRQAPGDVYFQHEGQLIHSVSYPPHCLSLLLSPALSRFTSTHCSLSLPPSLYVLFCFGFIWWWKPAGRVLTKDCFAYSLHFPLTSLFSVWFLFPVMLTPLVI